MPLTPPAPKIIAIDGPAGAGKGTIARLLAEAFNFALLDTGALYRATAWQAHQQGVALDDSEALAAIAAHLPPEALTTPALRTSATGEAASAIASLPAVRAALHAYQQQFAQHPPDGKQGAVLDGRDIGTVICPEAPVKLFLTADIAIRAQRRWLELGKTLDFSMVLQDMKQRDARDSSRTHAPLKPAADALVIDTSHKNISDVFTQAKEYASGKLF